ncbi:phosphoribosylanthranilate isomerase [Kineobactrum sediminis]|uniref:N-(5'-phosphoribosyl)anthranilate isomerase n=1 Tax=Kineobactrum sediminis TaxID=1905677 RepID=A0A2N5Y389_9GAMM|nr:phosphoribosylanthranilate isomerase [Kineobactrum sediminis]PLW82853.1 phosphoribosylanthranilate isomerase [Kineobactrum sediminis]
MPRTFVKICGITSGADAQAACEAGADALGLVFYGPSSRCVSPAQAAEIVAAVPPLVTIVALFVDAPTATIHNVLKCVPIDCIQFHGDEPAAFCDQFQRPYLKAIRMREGVDVADTCSRYGGARGVLLDSWQQGMPGGTGKTFDWTGVPRDLSRPVVLAGGLNPGNVARAIAAIRPAAVDVSGGVELAPGYKDQEKMIRFIAAVRAADQQQGI